MSMEKPKTKKGGYWMSMEKPKTKTMREGAKEYNEKKKAEKKKSKGIKKLYSFDNNGFDELIWNKGQGMERKRASIANIRRLLHAGYTIDQLCRDDRLLEMFNPTTITRYAEIARLKDERLARERRIRERRE